MPRRVQDIVPGDRRTMREEVARPVKRTSAKTPERQNEKSAEPDQEIPIHRIATPYKDIPLTPPVTKHRRRSSRKGLWTVIVLGIIVVIAGAGYVTSAYYAKATFTIVPKSLSFPLSDTYIAQGTPSSNSLSYEVVTIHAQASSTVTASNGPQTSSKASGSVTLYNAYSASAMRLIAGTRLLDEASSHIYRLTSTVTIPGYTKPAGNVIPGTVVATIIADQPGEAYNISSTDNVSDLKIAAYKGTTKYDSVYARLHSEITGGFVGAKKIVSPAVIAATAASLTSQLTTSLLAQAKAAVPGDFLMYDGAYTTTFAKPSVGGGDSSSAVIGEQGTLYGILLPRNGLISAIAGKQASSLFGSFAYTAPGLESLSLSFANIKDFTPDKKPALVIHGKGSLKVVATVPVETIKKKLAGMALGSTESVFKSYSQVIESSSGELTPPWAKIPTDLSRITVNVTNP